MQSLRDVCMKTDRLVSRQYGALLVGAFVTMMAPATHAETRLTGQVDAVRMEVRDASFEEIFDALGASYGLRRLARSAHDGTIIDRLDALTSDCARESVP